MIRLVPSEGSPLEPRANPSADPDPGDGHRAGRLRALIRALLAVDSTQEPPHTLQAIGRAVAHAVPHDRFSVHTLHPQDGIRSRMGRGDATVPLVDDHRLPLEGSIVGEVIRTGRPMLVPNAQAHPMSYYFGPRPRVDHLAVLPLRSGGRVTGAIVLGRSADPPFDRSDLPVLRMFADRASAALREADLIDELRRANGRLRALAAAGRQLVEALDPAEAPSRVAGAAREMMSARGAALWMRTAAAARNGGRPAGAETGHLRLTARAGETPPALPRTLHTAAPGAIGEAVRGLAPALEPAGPGPGEPTLPGCWLPLARGGVLEGVLGLWRESDRPFSADDLLELAAFGPQAAAALRNAATYAEAMQRAEREPLTGLPNHAALHRHLEQSCATALRRLRPLSVVMLDLNDLKHINDAHGHPAGDAALRALADALRAAARRADVVGRYGGDEFMAILVDCGTAGAADFGARVRRLLTERPGPFAPGALSVAVGWAEFPAQARSPREVVALADAALYADKRRHAGGTGRGGAQWRARPHLG
jgi:diguanylate cyclase (GGDEF)-like protein